MINVVACVCLLSNISKESVFALSVISSLMLQIHIWLLLLERCNCVPSGVHPILVTYFVLHLSFYL